MMNDPIDGPPATPVPRARFPDAHGEAALLLVESLIHQLLADAKLTLASALSVVQTAIDSLDEANADRGDTEDRRKSLALLAAIARTLGIDAGQPAPE